MKLLSKRRLPVVSVLSITVMMLFILAALPSKATGSKDGPEENNQIAIYWVGNVFTKEDRTAIARTGADIVEIGESHVIIHATTQEASQVSGLGFPIEQMLQAEDFPVVDAAYHNYAEMVAEIQQAAAAHPEIVSSFSIGQSYEGRELWAVKISDNVALDEEEPEVLFIGQHHAREHITVEMSLYILDLLADNYGIDSQITDLVNGREVFIIFSTNPDGSEYDIASGAYRSWRKNRQPNSGSS